MVDRENVIILWSQCASVCLLSNMTFIYKVAELVKVMKWQDADGRIMMSRSQLHSSDTLSCMTLMRLMKMKIFNLFLIVSITFTTLYFVVIQLASITEVDRAVQLKLINATIHNQASSLACIQPNLSVFSPDMMKFVREVPPLDCSLAGLDWVKCEGSECTIQEKAKEEFGPIKCTFTDIIRINDIESKEGDATLSDLYYKLENSDVVRVSCKSQRQTWVATLTGIRQDPNVWEKSSWTKLPSTATKFNVLIFGLDSLSKNSFIRKLPKSYRMLTEVLGGDVLQSYNIVGDGTPQALIPILTGKTELELPDTRKRFPNTQFVNTYPFIWNDYKHAGYVTAFFEDLPQTGTFTYRLNGFNETPTDHYMRPYYVASYKEQKKWPKYCTGEIPRHKIMLNQIRNFFTVYKQKPKFLFGFHGELSHDDCNLIGVADNDVLEFLQGLKSSGLLKDTILIIMADHGHRFAEIRNTLQGKQEERLPFFSFTFPSTFKNHFKGAYENFKSNLNKLTTPFDIYQTLKSILELNHIGEADISKRAVSLFDKIPGERSCAHACIEPHWCTCLDWYKISATTPIATRIADAFVSVLNNYTESHRYMCERLSLSKIEWIMQMTPNEDLIKFHKNADIDGFLADLSAKMTIKTDLYQVKVILVPGNSIFEGSLTHLLDQDTISMKMTDISRVNLYGAQARCVENDFPHLRKYCYCKD